MTLRGVLNILIAGLTPFAAMAAIVVAIFLFGRALHSRALAGLKPEGGKCAHQRGEVFEVDWFYQEGVGSEVIGFVDVVNQI